MMNSLKLLLGMFVSGSEFCRQISVVRRNPPHREVHCWDTDLGRELRHGATVFRIISIGLAF